MFRSKNLTTGIASPALDAVPSGEALVASGRRHIADRLGLSSGLDRMRGMAENVRGTVRGIGTAALMGLGLVTLGGSALPACDSPDGMGQMPDGGSADTLPPLPLLSPPSFPDITGPVTAGPNTRMVSVIGTVPEPNQTKGIVAYDEMTGRETPVGYSQGQPLLAAALPVPSKCRFASVNAAGQRGPWSSPPIEVLLDNQAPDPPVPVKALVRVRADARNVSIPFTIPGDPLDPRTFEVLKNGVSLMTMNHRPGDTTLTLNEMPPQDALYQVVSIDQYGNKSAPGPAARVEVDPNPPKAPAWDKPTTVTVGPNTQSVTYTATLNAGDTDVSEVSLGLDGAPFTPHPSFKPGDRTFPVEVPAGSAMTVRVGDGLYSTDVTLKVEVDAAPPNAPRLSDVTIGIQDLMTVAPVTVDKDTVEFDVTPPKGNVITVKLQPHSEDVTENVAIPLDPMQNNAGSLLVKARDRVGNESVTAQKIEYKAPTFSQQPKIDCSIHGGLCGSGGRKYPITAKATDAISVVGVTVDRQNMPNGYTSGSVENVKIDQAGNITFDYVTGEGSGPNIPITITVEVEGPDGKKVKASTPPFDLD